MERRWYKSGMIKGIGRELVEADSILLMSITLVNRNEFS